MKLKVLSFAFALILLCSFIPQLADAQSNNNLEWGVEVDEEFTYVMQRMYLADPSYAQVVARDLPLANYMIVGEKATLTVTGLSEIPMQINESSQMPQSSCDLKRTNDSVSIATGLLDFVIAIGDWEFVNQMTNLTPVEGITLTLIESEDEWGTIGAGSFQAGDGSIVTVTTEFRYEKENGTLNYLRLRYATLGTDLIDIIIVNWHPGMPTFVAASIQTPTVLIISIAAQ